MLKKLFRQFVFKYLLYSLIFFIVLSFSITERQTDETCKYLTSANAAVDGCCFRPEWPHEKSELFPDPSLVFGRLPNGFRYVLMENRTPKDRVSMHLNINVGSMHESDQQQGLAHFLEHMLFDGSTHFKPGELVKYFQSIGMKFGPDANAHTGYYETVYDMLLPKGDRQSLDKGLAVLKDFADGAIFPSSEIDRERRVVLAEKRTRDSESYRKFVSIMKFEFPEAKISKRFPIGLENFIKNADRKIFKSFYDTWYRPEKMILVMTGDFDAGSAALLIDKKFSALAVRASRLPEPDLGKINHKGIKPFYHFEKETGNTTVSIEVIRKILQQPDSFDFQKRLLIKDIADQIVQNRLDILVSKPDTPFTSASISSGIFGNQIESAEITAECSPENWEKTLALLEQTLRRSLKYGFTTAELERVKKDFISKLDSAVNKAQTRESGLLAREIIMHLNADMVFLSPEQRRDLLSPVVNFLTLKQAHDSFKESWAPEHRLVLVTGNVELKTIDEKPKDLIIAAYNRSSMLDVSRPSEINVPVFPYLPEPEKKGEIISRVEILELGIVQVDFKNGVSLALKKTDFEADEVLVNLSFGLGRTVEPLDKAGLADLSAEVINESGLGRLKKDEIESALTGRNTDVNFFVNEDSFSFKGKTVSKEVQLLFRLLYAHLTDPGYMADAYKLSMERFRQKYLKLSSSIDGAMSLTGKRFLAGEDSRFGLPPYNIFNHLTLNDVKSWLGASLRHDKINISVVGVFDINAVVDLTSKYFGSLPERRDIYKQNMLRLPQFPAAQTFKINVATEIPKGLVVVAYPTEDLWDIHRTRLFSVLADIVSERLRERVREKLGAAYSFVAYNTSSRTYPGYGVFQTFVHVDPKEGNMVVGEVKKIISDLVVTGVNNEELRRAIKPTLTGIKDMLQNNYYWLNTVLSGSKKHPQQLDWSRTIMDDYASITKEELSILAKQYLDNDKAAVIIVKPEQRD
ncbi:MAG: insulinase family protein [Candidatus Desulfaltia sp.]|nr:insulinase family protein [Candidatus Desulfaltia sp.]